MSHLFKLCVFVGLLALLGCTTLSSDNSKILGEKVSFDFKKVKLADGWQLLAGFSDSVVVYPKDTKQISAIRAKNKPWNLVFDATLRANAMSAYVGDNATLIASPEQMKDFRSSGTAIRLHAPQAQIIFYCSDKNNHALTIYHSGLIATAFEEVKLQIQDGVQRYKATPSGFGYRLENDNKVVRVNLDDLTLSIANKTLVDNVKDLDFEEFQCDVQKPHIDNFEEYHKFQLLRYVSVLRLQNDFQIRFNFIRQPSHPKIYQYTYYSNKLIFDFYDVQFDDRDIKEFFLDEGVETEVVQFDRITRVIITLPKGDYALYVPSQGEDKNEYIAWAVSRENF